MALGTVILTARVMFGFLLVKEDHGGAEPQALHTEGRIGTCRARAAATETSFQSRSEPSIWPPQEVE